MLLVKKETKTFVVSLLCENCPGVEMRSTYGTGDIFLLDTEVGSSSPYRHECPKCGVVVFKKERYPRMVVETYPETSIIIPDDEK